MHASIMKFVRDEHGAIVSAELIIILTVVVLALVVGWNAVAAALVGELTDIAGAFGSLNQSYSFRGVSAQDHASCSGSGFVDSGSTFNLTSNSGGTSGGGGGGSSNFIAGGGGGGGGGGANLAAPQPALRAAPNLNAAREPDMEELVAVIDEATDETTEAEELLAIREGIAALRQQLVVIQEEEIVDGANARAANTSTDEELANVRRLLSELCAELKRLEAKSLRSTRPIPPAAPQ